MSNYLTFCLLAFTVGIAPGPDSFLTLRHAVAGGRPRGLMAAAGITLAGCLQGLLAACGLGAIIVHAEPVFQTIRWAGIAYLVWLGVQAIRTAIRGEFGDWHGSADGANAGQWRAFRQGFLCNITNPKVLAFNLAVLPQFVGQTAFLPVLIGYGLTQSVAGGLVLLAIVLLAQRASAWLRRRRVQRTVEGATGAVMLGFAAGLALEG